LYFIRNWFAYIFAVGLLEFSLECRNLFILDLNYNDHTCIIPANMKPHGILMHAILFDSAYTTLYDAFHRLKKLTECGKLFLIHAIYLLRPSVLALWCFTFYFFFFSFPIFAPLKSGARGHVPPLPAS